MHGIQAIMAFAEWLCHYFESLGIISIETFFAPPIAIPYLGYRVACKQKKTLRLGLLQTTRDCYNEKYLPVSMQVKHFICYI